MTLHAERQCFQTLQQDKSIERRDRSSCITQNDSPDTSDESCRTRHIGKDRPMITWVRFAQGRELIGICFPIEIALSTITPPKLDPWSADKFGGGNEQQYRPRARSDGSGTVYRTYYPLSTEYYDDGPPPPQHRYW